MAPKHISMIVIAAVALAGSGPSLAQEYRPDEFLNLDLSRAVLSPKPLGPSEAFRPGPLDVTVDRGNRAAATVSGVTVAEPKAVPTATVHVASEPPRADTRNAVSRIRAARAQMARPTPHAPRALVTLHRRNPVESQARDAGIHTWPCKSGGICNWKR